MPQSDSTSVPRTQPTAITIDSARALAAMLHDDQMYGAGEPYMVHLEAVGATLLEFTNPTSELCMAAWLHDVIEDTPATVQSLIAAGVPIYAVALVDAVTDRPGKNRAERHAATYPRIARIPDAVTLKLADRIANVRACIAKNDPRLSMYRDEHPEFYAALRHSGPAGMWRDLALLLSPIKFGDTVEHISSHWKRAATVTALTVNYGVVYAHLGDSSARGWFRVDQLKVVSNG